MNDLKSALDMGGKVKGVWKVASGEYDIIALVESEELGDPGKELSDLIDFQESLGKFTGVYFDEEKGQRASRQFVHKVSFNLIFPDSNSKDDLQFAVPIGPQGTNPPRGVSDVPEFL